jgi:hypothetical protein
VSASSGSRARGKACVRASVMRPSRSRMPEPAAPSGASTGNR